MQIKKNSFKFLILILTFSFGSAYAKEYKELPNELKSALFLRILELNKTISEESPTICIHIINDLLMYEALKDKVGTKINEKEIKQITISEKDELPNYIPSVIYIGNSKNIDNITEFTKKNKILSVTGNPTLIKSEVTVYLFMLFNSPSILLKIKSSKSEDMKWNFKMMKISTLI